MSMSGSIFIYEFTNQVLKVTNTFGVKCRK